jgi:hypothetical protein
LVNGGGEGLPLHISIYRGGIALCALYRSGTLKV